MKKILFFLLCLCILISPVLADESKISLPYKQNLTLSYKTIDLNLDHQNPPIYVEFHVYPKMIHDQKIAYKGSSDMRGTKYNIYRPDEHAQFKISIKTDSNRYEDGYGGEFSSLNQTKKLIIRDNGPYSIEIYGNQVTVDLNIYSPTGSSQNTMVNSPISSSTGTVSSKVSSIPYSPDIFSGFLLFVIDQIFELISNFIENLIKAILIGLIIFVVTIVAFRLIGMNLVRLYQRISRKNLRFNKLKPLYDAKQQSRIAIQFNSLKNIDAILKNDPSNINAWFDRGSACSLLGQYQNAIEAYTQCIKISPDCSKAWNKRGETFIKMGIVDKAFEDINKALDLDQDNADAWSNKGEIYYILGIYGEALTAINTCLSLESNNVKGMIFKGAILSQSNQFEESLEYLNKVLERFPGNEDAWFYKGFALRKQVINTNDYRLHNFSNDPQSWDKNRLTPTDKYTLLESKKAYERTLEINPFLYGAWNNIGSVYLSLGKYWEALDAFEDSITCKEKNDAPWFNKGLTFATLYKFRTASRRKRIFGFYEKSLSLNPKYRDSWLNSGRILYECKKFQEALVRYNEAIKIDSTYLPAKRDKAQVLFTLHRYNEALTVWNEILSITGPNSYIIIEKGRIFYNLSKFDDALNAFEESINIKRKNILAWKCKAKVLFALHRYGPAFSSCMSIISLKKEEFEEKYNEKIKHHLFELIFDTVYEWATGQCRERSNESK